MYLAQLRGMSSREAAYELKQWFVRFGIQDWWHKKVEELSKGMAQKVQFITTVVHKPSLMILDEPFSGFDPVNAELIRKEILRLKGEGATIILSTHNMESVEELCDEIALINKAKLVITGGTDDIRRRFGEDNVEIEYTEDYVRKTEVVSREAASARLTELIEGGLRINSYRELVPRMNDIFIKLVTEGEGK
jgi:ABC-2 type transport system ATP-binding protein